MAFESKYPGTCEECKLSITKGEMIEFDFDARRAYHEDCAPDRLRRGRRTSSPSSSREERPAYKPSIRRSSSAALGAVAMLGTGDGPKIAVCAFNKHIASEMEARLQASTLIEGSDEQRAIWDVMLNDDAHMIVNASAGSGKSFSAQQGVLRLMQAKGASASASTYHSLGLSILRKHIGKVNIHEWKLNNIADTWKKPEAMDDETWRKIISLTIRLVRLCKNYLINGTDLNRLQILADYHTVEIENEEIGNTAFALVANLIQESNAQPNIVDFDDMVYLPVVLNLTGGNLDMLIVDELQDTNIAQQHLAKLACPKGRIIGIGDEHQAIYSFRGADSAAMSRFKAMLENDERGCVSLPLSVTRRCSLQHVQMAQNLVGGSVIRAMEGAPDGYVGESSMNHALNVMEPGDMVMCRVNRYLIPCAYDLIRRGIKAVVRGRDIGGGIESLIKRLGSPMMVVDLLEELEAYRKLETAKLTKQQHSESRMAALYDKCDTLIELSDGMSHTSQIVKRIEQIFADFDADGKPINAVVLGTVHRLKGLESHRVWVLAPELIPHPMASMEWEKQSEENLAYVACTRAKYDREKNKAGDLIFIGNIPEIYRYKPQYNAKVEVEPDIEPFSEPEDEDYEYAEQYDNEEEEENA